MKAAIAPPRRPRKRHDERFRFPCGHLESRNAVEPRIRLKSVAAWVSCQRCRVIVLAIQRHP